MNIFLFHLLTGVGRAEPVLISGRTMGTTYHVKVVTNQPEKIKDLPEKVDVRLKAIN